MLIATNQNGGSVSRLSSNHKLTGGRNFPSPQEVYKKRRLAGIEKEDTQVAKILRTNKTNTNSAPVADVAKDHSSFIYDRTLGVRYTKTAHYNPSNC